MCRSIKTLHNFAPPATDDEIRHVNMLFLNFMPGVIYDSRALYATAGLSAPAIT
jgi:hypothetical protein